MYSAVKPSASPSSAAATRIADCAVEAPDRRRPGAQRCGSCDVVEHPLFGSGMKPGLAQMVAAAKRFRGVIDVNLKGAFWVAQACGP